MSSDPLSLAYPALGAFMDNNTAPFRPAAQGISFINTATNLRIKERIWRTRKRWRELACLSAPADWATASTQGAVPFDPSSGSTTSVTVPGKSGIIESAAGKLYRITPDTDSFSVEDISHGTFGKPTMRLAWMAQATQYVVRTDAVSRTQIWDATSNTTLYSTGYNYNAPSSSRLPNYAGPVVFTDRIWIVNNGNEVLVGDHLHRLDLTGNTDVLKMTDQSFDITSSSFTSPNDLGDINSLHSVTSARGGNLSAQGEVIAGTVGPGLWGITSGLPRSQWATASMKRVIHPDLGPTGPYAAYAAKDELLMRTLEGITSLKYAEAEFQNVGNPHINVGQEIKPLLDKDPLDLLRYASVLVDTKAQRASFTVWPVVDGAHRWHKGFVTAALSPGRTRIPEPLVWEGVQTLPEAMGEVIQFVELRGSGCRRFFALLRKTDGTKGLAEWTLDDGDDLLADGTCVPIKWQLLSRKLCIGSEYAGSSWGEAYLNIANIRKSVNVTVSARERDSDPFKEFWSGTIYNETWNTLDGAAESPPIPLGTRLAQYTGPWIQILIQGEGSCSVDMAIAVSPSGSPPRANAPKCIPGERLCTFDQFQRS